MNSDSGQVLQFVTQLAIRRRTVGLDRAEVARRLGVSKAAVRTWETGERNPSLQTALNYAALVGMRVLLAPTEQAYPPVNDWQSEVANGDTVLGYHEWVANQRDVNQAWEAS